VLVNYAGIGVEASLLHASGRLRLRGETGFPQGVREGIGGLIRHADAPGQTEKLTPANGRIQESSLPPGRAPRQHNASPESPMTVCPQVHGIEKSTIIISSVG